MDLVEVALAVLVVGVLIFLFLSHQKKGGENTNTEKLIEDIKQDREIRHREIESLRSEMRTTTKTLQEQFDRVNKTVDSKITESSKHISDRLDKAAVEISKVHKEAGKMSEMSEKIEALNRILRSPKSRGSMGEEVLEEMLRAIFPNHLWQRQYSLGSGLTVDIAIKTSGGIIPVDAKFSLPAFEKIFSAENEEEEKNARREFQKDTKKRIDEVSKYVHTESGTLPFAIMFMPNENMYYEAAVRDADLAEYSRKKRVLLTGPQTMVYVLQILLQAYQSQELARDAQKVFSELVGIKHQSERLDEEIGVMAKHVSNAHTKVGDVQIANQKLQNQLDNTTRLQDISESEKLS